LLRQTRRPGAELVVIAISPCCKVAICGSLHDIGGAPSSITNAAVDDLKLAPGKEAYAVVKASDVMISVD
jgi:molybdopterin-binding protein